MRRLEKANLSPASDADRNALVRRLYFDLIGLPPTPEQRRDFVQDESPDAVERLVDQLLDSPHFGERWGRHWLDLVRYAESRGHEFDNDTPNAYQYRDYIIRALNADVPYDQLVREHIAGDLLDPPRRHPQHGFNESILGTGFWFLGEWVHSPVDVRKDESDRFDNMIDVMSKTFLGMTVSCARCHDHKFDAISTADYYSLSGFLQSSDYRQVRFESLEHNRRLAQQLAKLDQFHREQISSAIPLAENPPPFGTLSAAEAIRSCLVVDYAEIRPDEFLQDGFLFGDRPRRAGEPYLAIVDGEPTVRLALETAATSDSFWDGLEAIDEKGVHSRSRLDKLPRSGRTLRTPTFTLREGKVHCRVKGSGHVVACVDSHRLVAGPLHGETIEVIEPGKTWVQLKLDRYVGHRLHLEFTPDKDASMEVSMVLQGASPAVLKHVDRLAAEVETSVQQRNKSLTARLADESDDAAELRQQIAEWGRQRAELQSQVQHRSRVAVAMMDGTGEDDHVLIRGSSANPGEVAPRRFLAAIAGDHALPIARGSGRVELAEQINDPTNPLTSRVIVNRIWHHLMGRGIVPTTDDFGVLGQRPTHPALLDHLATRFLADGRSIKRMIRYLVLTRVYQMSSHADAVAVSQDPKNLLWHHRPPKRLEGETIRDALLAISDRLDNSLFGPPVPIHLTSFMDGRGRPPSSGPMDGNGRRSIYVAVRRNFLSPFMLTFDMPVPFSTMGRRNVSNVPAQALILMNDPLVVDQAKQWAERAAEIHPGDGESAQQARLDWMYETAFSRQPSEAERRAAMSFLADRANRGDGWADFAHALVNTKEFIFLR